MPTPVAPLQVVAPIVRTPLPYGLFSVLGFRGDDSGEVWRNGVAWETDTCEEAGGIAQWQQLSAEDIANEVEITGLPKQLNRNRGADGAASPFVVYGHFACSPMSYSQDEMQGKALDHLFLKEEARVEQALWTGDLGNVPNFAGANGFAAPNNVGSFTAKDITYAIAAIEQYLAETYGSLGVIHMSRQLASATDPNLSKKNGRLVTSLDTPVVVGTGYGHNKIVGTAAMVAYRSDPFIPSNVPYDLLDRAKNDMVAVAEREYVVGFDPCGLVEATITTAE